VATYIFPVSPVDGKFAIAAYSSTSSTYDGSCEDGTRPLTSVAKVPEACLPSSADCRPVTSEIACE
jgi:hypothetical protein